MTGDISALDGQEADAARGLFRRAGAVHWDLLVNRLFDHVGNRVPHFGGHRTDSNGVHRDVAARQFDGKRLGETDDSRLRRRIVRLSEGNHELTGRRRDVDDSMIRPQPFSSSIGTAKWQVYMR